MLPVPAREGVVPAGFWEPVIPAEFGRWVLAGSGTGQDLGVQSHVWLPCTSPRDSVSGMVSVALVPSIPGDVFHRSWHHLLPCPSGFEHGKAVVTVTEQDWPQKNLVQVLAGCKNNSRETLQGNACGGDMAPENGEIQGHDVSACPCLWRTGLRVGESLPTACLFLLQYIFVSLISRDSVYDVLRRVCTHLQVPSLLSYCVHGPEALHLPFGLSTAPHHCLQGFGLVSKLSPIPSILTRQQGMGRGAGGMPWARSVPVGFSGSWMRQSSEFLLSLRAWV